MESTVGVVDNVTVRDGKNARGPWTLTKAKVGGDWLTTFNKDLGKQLIALDGELVEVGYEIGEPKGDFPPDKILQSVKKAKAAPTPDNTYTQVNTPADPLTRSNTSTKDGNIAKAVALKAAVDAIPFEAYGSIDEYVSDVGRLSDCFVGWLQNGTSGSVSPTQGEIDLVVKETQSSLPGTF